MHGTSTADPNADRDDTATRTRDRPSPRASSGSRLRALELAFWILELLVAVLGARLASLNGNDGGWDSASNLIAARNVAQGRGFTTPMVQDFVVVHTIPAPETVRAPGLVYLLAALFRVAGVSLAVPVLLNTALLLVTAIVLRVAVREVAPRWFGDVAGLLVLLSMQYWGIVSAMNNALLVLFTAMALLLAVRHAHGRLSDRATAITLGVIAAAAFLTKQSYVVGFGPLAVVMFGTKASLRPRRRASYVLLAGAIGAVLTAPYWVPNLQHYGHLIYSPIQQLRLPYRYGLVPTDGYQRAILFDHAPPSYRSMIAQLGLHEVIRHELDVARMLTTALTKEWAGLLFLALSSLLFARRRSWRLYAAAATLLIPPFFDSLYWVTESRYLFPLLPILLFVAALGIGGYAAFEAEHAPFALERRMRTGAGVLLGALVCTAAFDFRWGWREEYSAGRRAAPSWRSAIEALPADAVVMSDGAPMVSWWTGRKTIVEPLGTRTDLVHVAALYHPRYYLDVATQARADRPPFATGELRPVAAGSDWRLYEISALPQ
jgi:4-amino-4-deoxy-L-arabinose transferase-like glycosyltransferase